MSQNKRVMSEKIISQNKQVKSEPAVAKDCLRTGL
jgi:hypothetical protein